MDATMLWPTPRNFVRSLRCTFDVLLWSQKQTFRLFAPFLGFDATRPTRPNATDPTAEEARAAGEVAAAIEAIDEIVAIDGPVEDVEAVVEELEAAEEIGAVEAAVAAPAQPTQPATADDLTNIGGVGPKLAERLTAAGVTSFATLAAWQATDVERFEATLPPVQRGRVEREDWIGQARLLALTVS